MIRRGFASRTGRAASRVAPVLFLILAGCARNAPQDTLAPEGRIGEEINALFWPVFWIAVAVFFIVEGGFLYALIRFRARRSRGEPEQVHGNTRLEIAWTAVPALLLAVIAVFTVRGVFKVAARPSGNPLEVKVTAHQWWWEYEYSDLELITANELNIPVGRPVYLTLESVDVIHSFWVPKLAGKQDVVPGRTNALTIEAERPGTYLGQCAEFCGLSHANMRLRVIARENSDFEEWVADQTQPATRPSDPLAAQGERIFLEGRCVECHAVAGTDAQARLAPDLTHFSSRETFAGAIFANTDENLRDWLDDPPAMKPMSPDKGLGMPDYDLTEDEIVALIAYLRALE